jgi:hypothetical protein
MNSYTQAAMERAMKVQEVMLQAMANKTLGVRGSWETWESLVPSFPPES